MYQKYSNTKTIEDKIEHKTRQAIGSRKITEKLSKNKHFNWRKWKHKNLEVNAEFESKSEI